MMMSQTEDGASRPGRTLTSTEVSIGFQRLERQERVRTYVFEGGERLVYHNVWALAVRPSGNHRLMCDEGLVIVGTGWLAVELDADGWDF